VKLRSERVDDDSVAIAARGKNVMLPTKYRCRGFAAKLAGG